MIGTVLFFIHHGLTLLLGVTLSAAFCGIAFSKRNAAILSGIFLVCGISQLSALALLGEQRVWELYPLIVHALLGIMLCAVFKKRFVTVLAAVTLAYLCCQPSKWFGMLAITLTDNEILEWVVRIVVSVAVAVLSLRYFADSICELFNKDTRSVVIFSSLPVVYYLFDYTAGIYTDLWLNHARLTAEFLAFFLCVVFMAFCIVYYREYEKKLLEQQKNQMIEIKVQQQARQIETIRKSSLETSLLRHDMRLLLSNLAVSISNDDKESALNLISGYAAQVEAAAVHRYCENDTLNYTLSNFENKCQKTGVDFQVDLQLGALPVDEVMFSTVISNALDNALNAQMDLEESRRKIKLMLKDSNGKLLLSVKNPFSGPSPLDETTQMPVATKEGHGFGTRSIVYMTEKLGGKCQFSVQDHTFILRIVI